jgi:hypothetical protein
MKERSLFVLLAVLALLAITSLNTYTGRWIDVIAYRDPGRGSAPIAIGSWNPAVESGEATAAPSLLTSWWRRLEAWLWRQSPVSDATLSNANTAAPFIVSHLEVTQAVQNLAQPVPLIAGKPTVVRAFLESRQGNDVSPIRGTLYASSDNGRTWMAFKAENAQAVAAVAPAAVEGAGDEHALRFILPPAVARDSLLLSLHTNLGGGEQWQRSNLVTLIFEEIAPFRIAYLPLQFEGALPEAERLARAHTYMQMIYPLAEVDYFPLPYAAPYQGSKAGDQVTHFLRRLHALYQFTGWPENLGAPDQLFGWAPHSTWRLDGRADPYWFNNGDSRIAFGTDSPANKAYQAIMAHEIGHNLGRQHPTCAYTATDWPHPTYAIYDIGFDFGFYASATPYVHPATDDFMIGSNCGADIYANKWISAHNYQKLHESLTSDRFKRRAGEQVVVSDGATPASVYLVSGRIYDSGRAEFDTVYQVDVADYLAPQAQSGSDFCLVLENSLGERVSGHCFDLSLEDARRYGRAATFTYALPYVPDASRLALLRGGERLAQRPFSANAPTIEILSPAVGTVLPDMVEVAWRGQDADGDPLSYILSYSPDAGGSWYHLAYEFKGNRLVVDMSRLPGGEQALFRLMASDGVHTAVAMAGPFPVENRPPQTFILLPEDDIAVYQEQTLLLSGYGYDLEDGLLSEDGLHWFSDVAGYLGSGRQIVVRDLPPGRHVITLTAADSSGQSTAASIPIEVR